MAGRSAWIEADGGRLIPRAAVLLPIKVFCICMDRGIRRGGSGGCCRMCVSSSRSRRRARWGCGTGRHRGSDRTDGTGGRTGDGILPLSEVREARLRGRKPGV